MGLILRGINNTEKSQSWIENARGLVSKYFRSILKMAAPVLEAVFFKIHFYYFIVRTVIYILQVLCNDYCRSSVL